MRVALITPWANAWIPYFKASFESRGHEFVRAQPGLMGEADLYLHGWASGMSQPIKGAKNVMFMRRFELFEGGLDKINWSHIDHLICVNTWIAERVREVFAERKVSVPVSVIYNGTDCDRWKFKVRAPGKRIGMACHVHPKKNLPLALQVLASLPDGYELHIAGEVQDSCTAEYLNNLGEKARRKVYLYGHIDASQLSLWWEGMNYCLSTSISEGNPNNVIEAMAKGIKPVVHSWPGAEDQFQPWLFTTVGQAVKQILTNEYESEIYRGWVRDKFSLKNIEAVVDLAESLRVPDVVA